MALSEDEIVRYSRQILLKEVGGQGQERLLAATIELVGAGPALAVAAAYLRASGVREVWPRRAVREDEVGFEFGRDRVGAPMPEGEGPVSARLAVAPVAVGAGEMVVIGSVGAAGAIAFASAATCRACLERTLAALGPPPPELGALLGSTAALALQRRLLGIGAPAGLVTVTAGVWTERPISRCETCGLR